MVHNEWPSSSKRPTVRPSIGSRTVLTISLPGGIRLDSDEGQMGSRARDEVKSLDKTIEQLAATAQQQQQANRLVRDTIKLLY